MKGVNAVYFMQRLSAKVKNILEKESAAAPLLEPLPLVSFLI
jgi:hypothetical protein